MKIASFVLAFALAACQGSPSYFGSAGNRAASALYPAGARRAGSPSGTISHVVIIIQENRTPDNLFHCLPNTDTCPPYGMNSHGQQVAFHQTPLNWPADISHTHPTFLTEYDNGKLDGFNLAPATSKYCTAKGDCAYAYVPPSQVGPYITIAQQYAFADRMFQTNEGPSYPAHFEFVAGSAPTGPSGSGLPQFAENTVEGYRGGKPGCDAKASVKVLTIPLEPIGAPEGNPIFPCVNVSSLADELNTAGVTWRYYVNNPGPGLWNPYDSIQSVRYSPQWSNVVSPSQVILSDISSGQLPAVAWVTPDADHSDHSGSGNDSGGPSWVAAIINAIGQSPYWNSTAIFVTWDDWGGWYDHVSPTMVDNYELGMRVPLLVVSPYTPAGYVSEVPHQFGSILHFTEEAFGLPSLGTNDSVSDDLSDCFNFYQTPRAFTVIPAPPFYPSSRPSARVEDP